MTHPRHWLRAVLLVLAAGLLAPTPAGAVQPNEKLDDPALEERARDISRTLRCVVCQNQSIDDSNAELARDMRIVVRERLQAGDTNQEVKDFMVARYGDFVLLEPPVRPRTLVLWFGPVVVLLLGVLAVLAFYRRRDTAPEALSVEEEQRVAALLAAAEDAPANATPTVADTEIEDSPAPDGETPAAAEGTAAAPSSQAKGT